MPPVTQPIDALWHYLCPSFARWLPVSTISVRSFNRLTSRHSPHGLHSATHKTNRGLQVPLNSPILNLQPQRRRANAQHNLLHTGRDANKSNDSIKPLGKPKKTKSSRYEELRRASNKGEYLQVQDLVRGLIEEGAESPNTRLYTALLLANTSAEYGSLVKVQRLLQEMRDDGVHTDSAAYHAVLKVLAVHPDYVLRYEVLEELEQRWFTLTDDGWHDVIVGLIRDRQIEMAMDKLEHMQRERMKIRPWLHDLVIFTLCDAEEFEEVLRIMRYRFDQGELHISGTLWSYILDTASQSLHHEATLYAWRKRVETDYLNPPSGVCINVLNTAARHGNFRLATDVFRILSRRTNTLQLCSYEALLESYINASDIRTALAILTIMASGGVQPEEATTRPLYLYLRDSPSRPLEALSNLRDLKDAQRAIPTVVINCILEASIHQDDLASAIETYKILHTLCPAGPTTATFNALFRGCSKASRKDLAMFLASEMLALKIPPDALTYDRLILVCIDGRGKDDYADAFQYFEEMKGMGWWPRRGTLVAMVKRCCEDGDERAFGLLEEMEGRGMEVVGMQRWVGESWKGLGEARKAREIVEG